MILGRGAPASLLLIKRVLRPLLCNPALAIPVKGGIYTRSRGKGGLFAACPSFRHSDAASPGEDHS